MPFSQVEHKVASLVVRLLARVMDDILNGILECSILFFSVLESGTVSVFIPGKKYGEDADQQLSIPVHCSFWALADASLRSGRTECTIMGTAVGLMTTLCCNTFIICMVKMKHGLDLQKQVSNKEVADLLLMFGLRFREQEMGLVPTQLADAFGLVIQCRDMMGKQGLLAQTVHTLQQAVQSGKPLYSPCWEFSTQEYKEVNKHVRSPSHLHCFYITFLY